MLSIRELRPFAAAAVFLLAVVGLASAEEEATFDPTTERLVAVDLESSTRLDRRELHRMLPVRIGEALQGDPCPEIEQRFMATQTFVSVHCSLVRRDDGVAIVVDLLRQRMVNVIRFSGNRTLSTEQLRRAARLQEGSVFNQAISDAARARLLALYKDEGFEEARIDVETNEFAPRELNVVFRIDEGEPRRISEITVDVAGAVPLPVPEDKMRKTLGMSVGDRFQRTRRRKAESDLKALLREQGYYEADVELRWAELPPRGGTLTMQIDLGPLVELHFDGNQNISDRQLTKLIDIESRVIVTDGTWRELARRIRRAYQEKGYYFSKVDVQIEPGPPKIVRYTIDEGEAYRIASVTFSGDVGVPPESLKAVMLSVPASWIPWRTGALLDEEFNDDLKRLWFLYRRLGYESADIVDYRIRPDREARTLEVAVMTEAGRRTMVRDVRLVGFEVLEDKPPLLATRVAEPLNPEGVEADQQTLKSALTRLGYAAAEVDGQTETAIEGDVVGAVVTFTAHPDGRQRIGRIIIQNSIDTNAQVIRRELPFKEGDVLDPDALLRAQTNIYRLGLFRSVTVQPVSEPDAEGRRDVAISVLEKAPMTVQVGAGYNTRDGIRGFTEIAHNNLGGSGRRLSLRGDVNLDPFDQAKPNEYLANLGYREPRLFNSRWDLRANLIAQRATRSIDEFSVERYAFVPAVERYLRPGLQVGLEMQFEDARVFDVKPDVLAFNPRDEGKLRSISVGPFLIYDRRDDPFLPRRGTYDAIRWRLAPKELGADVPFVKLQVQHVHYLPLADYLTFAYVLRGGWAEALESGSEVPLRERFFLGGRTTVRGFSENSVGPKGAPIFNQVGNIVDGGGNPLGGDLALNANAELRFPLIYGLGGAVFVDGGGVYLQDRPILIDDFRRSAGLGVTYATPVGPITLDYGFKLDRRGDESVGEVHFSIGSIF
ncbi:MAG TPA: outer membrane protein assembly factor BamA [Candidatus Acidoferrales bacterium]|nr:outer membrane protein assembly factor BamA [Candidatus Acidoferrales bacterium]